MQLKSTNSASINYYQDVIRHNVEGLILQRRPLPLDSLGHEPNQGQISELVVRLYSGNIKSIVIIGDRLKVPILPAQLLLLYQASS